MTAGRASGIAATARLIASKSTSAVGSPRNTPIVNIAAAASTTSTDTLRPNAASLRAAPTFDQSSVTVEAGGAALQMDMIYPR